MHGDYVFEIEFVITGCVEVCSPNKHWDEEVQHSEVQKIVVDNADIVTSWVEIVGIKRIGID